MCLTDKIFLQTHVTFCEYLVCIRDRGGGRGGGGGGEEDYRTETARTIRDGGRPRTSTSVVTQLLSSDLVMLDVQICSAQITKSCAAFCFCDKNLQPMQFSCLVSNKAPGLNPDCTHEMSPIGYQVTRANTCVCGFPMRIVRA